jgi:hypothetical protein
MKKVMVLAVAAVVLLFGALNSESGVWGAYYPDGDDSAVYDRFSWDGWNHLAIKWNNYFDTASAIEMNPDGRPNVYYWGDIYDNVYPIKMYLYYSFNGYDWYYYGTYYYY